MNLPDALLVRIKRTETTARDIRRKARLACLDRRAGTEYDAHLEALVRLHEIRGVPGEAEERIAAVERTGAALVRLLPTEARR